MSKDKLSLLSASIDAVTQTPDQAEAPVADAKLQRGGNETVAVIFGIEQILSAVKHCEERRNFFNW